MTKEIQILQQWIFALAAVMAWAKAAASPSGKDRIWNASLWADLEPMPGSEAKRSMSSSSAAGKVRIPV